MFHNKYFHDNNINGLYIKIRVTKEELPAFISFSQLLPFLGISVTMPLKQDVLPFVENKSNVDAVNTLKVLPDHIVAINY